MPSFPIHRTVRLRDTSYLPRQFGLAILGLSLVAAAAMLGHDSSIQHSIVAANTQQIAALNMCQQNEVKALLPILHVRGGK